MANIKQLVVGYLFNDEMKEKIIGALNENIDIPILSEKTEAKILTAIYESIEEVIKAKILED